MKRRLTFYFLLLLVFAMLSGCADIHNPTTPEASETESAEQIKPATDPCPMRIAEAFYSYVSNSADGSTSMDFLNVQLENNWENKIVKSVTLHIEAYDKYGNQIVNGDQKSVEIEHEETIDFGTCSKDFNYTISDFEGVSIFRIYVMKVLTVDGQEWLLTDSPEYIDVKWNGRVTGQPSNQINASVDEIQTKIISSLSNVGLTYDPVEPLLYYGGIHTLWDSAMYLLQFDDFEVELSGDTPQDSPDKYFQLTFFLNLDSDREKINKIAGIVLPIICNISESQSLEIIEKGINNEDVSIDGYTIHVTKPITSSYITAPESGFTITLAPLN